MQRHPRAPANPEAIEDAMTMEELSAAAQLAHVYPSRAAAPIESQSPGQTSPPKLTTQEFLDVCGNT